ncbi:MAG: thiamine pyrophosphate-binding protein, partial [Candidatus Margulisiibacteriota bacterium]
LGDQEVDIISIVKSVTKYSVMVTDPKQIKKCLDKAIYLATHGRPGPVWLDIPMNIQGALVDEADLEEYDEHEDQLIFDEQDISKKVKETISLLRLAKRPIVLAGHGIRLSSAQESFLKLLEKMRIPILATFNGFDLVPTDHELMIGRIGTVGNRAGNFALQNADLVLSIGSRNNIRQISYSWKYYARHARKIVVDIDRAELNKLTLRPDIAIHSDAKYFIETLSLELGKKTLSDNFEWLSWCQARRNRYSLVPKKDSGRVNMYVLAESLGKLMQEGDVLVAGNGSACVSLFQTGVVKKNQRLFWNSGCAGMGYDLPAAIGASIALNRGNVICYTGDGSFQMNMQELMTVIHYRLPIKIIYLNNEGYSSISQTQNAFFEGRHTGCDENSGVSFPEIRQVAKAYGIRYVFIENNDQLKSKLRKALALEQACICEVKLEKDAVFTPKLSSEKKPDGRIISKPLEDMYPFLDREEFKENMIVPILNEND